MKFRDTSTTSEHELVIALKKCGHSVSLSTLADWRKEGLLPPFASQGHGKGRSYFWRETDIIARANLVHDLIRKYSRADNVILVLWLSGFSVSLSQFRRAWLHRAKAKKPWSSSSAMATSMCEMMRSDQTTARVISNRKAETTSDSAFLAVALGISATLALDRNDYEIATMRRVAGQVCMNLTGSSMLGGSAANGTRFVLLSVLWSVLESSDLLSVATDAEMLEAQRYIILFALFVRSCAPDFAANKAGISTGLIWPAQTADVIGTPLLLSILILIRSGFRQELHLTGIETEKLRACRERYSDCEGPARKNDNAWEDRAVKQFRHRLKVIWSPLLKALLA